MVVPTKLAMMTFEGLLTGAAWLPSSDSATPTPAGETELFDMMTNRKRTYAMDKDPGADVPNRCDERSVTMIKK